MKGVYVVEWNLPGCLPEVEPLYCSTLVEAKRTVREALLEHASDSDSPIHIIWSLRSMTARLVQANVSTVYASFEGYRYCINWIPERAYRLSLDED